MPRISPFLKQCFVTAAMGINVIGFSCCFGFPAILLPQLKEAGSIISISKDSESWIASIFPLTTLIGNFLTPTLMERFGRRTTHCVVGLIFIFGWFMIILATNVEIMIAGRAVKGIAGGILYPLRFILLGEYTSPKNRGAFLTTVSLSQAFGLFVVHLLGSLLSWQITALICVFFPFTSFIMTMYTPESPSWLLAKGKYDECRIVFKWLRGEDENEELEAMIKARMLFKKIEVTDNNQSRFRYTLNVIRKKEFYKPILIVIILNLMINLSGAPIMASYSTVVISILMGPTANAHFWMVMLDVLRLVFNFAAVYVINSVRRRVMVISTTGLCILSQAALAIYAYYKHIGWNDEVIWLPALFIILQVISVGIGMVPLPNVIAGEVFPLEYRSVAGTISMLWSSCLVFTVLKTFPALLSSIYLHGTYAFNSLILALSLLVIWLLLPETKGKTLQEIEDIFSKKSLTLQDTPTLQEIQLLRSSADETRAGKITDT